MLYRTESSHRHLAHPLSSPVPTLTSALHAGVPPEELLALAARAASEARHAVALPCELRPRTDPGQLSCKARRLTACPRTGNLTPIVGAKGPRLASPNCSSASGVGKAQSMFPFVDMFPHSYLIHHAQAWTPCDRV